MHTKLKSEIDEKYKTKLIVLYALCAFVLGEMQRNIEDGHMFVSQI